MPTSFNPEMGQIIPDGAGPFHATAALGSYTFSHMAGFGLLYQLTGKKEYAELGKECFEKALEGYHDRDRRYAFRNPHGPLRAGVVLGWTALGYDLCYDGWDEEYRKKVCLELANYRAVDDRQSLEGLTKGSMPPFSNHFGMQVGGSAMALLAVWNDPWADKKKIEALLKVSENSIIRNLTEGFGDGGFFAEGNGAGSMSSHLVFLSALQSWRIAGGKDFVSPRPNAQWAALKWIFLTVPKEGKMNFYAYDGMYPHNIWARTDKSGAGYFAIGMGAVSDQEKSALLWFYNHHLKESDAKEGAPYDTVSPYPHLAVSSFINWPVGMKEQNPAAVIPLCYRDSKWSFYAFRNRWQDASDVLITLQTKNAHGYGKAPTDAMLSVSGLGEKFKWAKLDGEVKSWQPGKDGSGILTMGNGTSLAVDFSKSSGAEATLVTTGNAEGQKLEVGGVTMTFKFLTSNTEPKPQVQGDKVVVGDQTVTIKDGSLILGTMAVGDGQLK